MKEDSKPQYQHPDLEWMVQLIKEQIKNTPALREKAKEVIATSAEDTAALGGLLKQIREALDSSSLPYERVIPKIGTDPMSIAVGVSRNTYIRMERGEITSLLSVKKVKDALEDILD